LFAKTSRCHACTAVPWFGLNIMTLWVILVNLFLNQINAF
jgi:hypothetical protein